MSGSNDRQVLNSGFVSSAETASGSAFTAGLNPTSGSAKAGRQRSSRLRDRMKARRLLVEGLERRELMAADTAVAMYNPLIANDVSGDFAVTPLDALLVINSLNSQSRSSSQFGTGLAIAATDVTSSPMVDVNRDGFLSALDALVVINQLNRTEAEGLEPILVAVRPQVFSSTGLAVNPDASGNYTLPAGDVFRLRVQAQDQRTTAGVGTSQGVFSAYVDVNYNTVGSPNTELAQVLWGEYQGLSFSSNLIGGNFSLNFGSQSTSLITVANSTDVDGFVTLDAGTTANNIRNAVGPLFGGVNNVRVGTFAQDGNIFFEISYLLSQSRQNVTDPTFLVTNLQSSNANTVARSITTSADPNTNLVLGAAFSQPANVLSNGGSVIYSGGPRASFRTIAGLGFELDDAGGFSATTEIPPAPGFARSFVNIFDTTFRSTGTGTVNFNIGSSESAQANFLLFGSNTAIPDSSIAFPVPFQIRFVQNIQADDITTSVAEDSGATNIPVTATLITGTSFVVESVTQPPANVGSATFLTNSRTVVFTPAANYFGPATFSYTVLSNVGDRSTANVSVTVNEVNDAPVVITPAPTLNVVEDSVAPLIITPSQIFTAGPLETTQVVTFGVPTLAAGQIGATVTRNADGNISVIPVANYFGPVVFTVVGADNGTNPANLSTTATVTVTVTPVNDPPEANTPALVTNEDTQLVIPASQLFRPGPAGIGAETSQTVSLTDVTAVSAATSGSIVLGANGASAVFTPAGNFFGEFVFSAISQDNGSPIETSVRSTFTIAVSAVNDAPTAVDDTGAAGFTILNIPGVVYDLNVMRNDSAGPGETTDPIRIVQLGALTGTGAATSSISIRPDGQRVLFTAGTGLFNLTQTFTYTIEDGGGLRSTATASVFIAPPILPFAVSDVDTVLEGSGARTIDVLANDLINSGETKKLLGFNTPSASQGIVTLLDNGTPTDLSDDKLSFTPTAFFSGPVTFTYRMIDTRSDSVESVGTVNITVSEVNDPPTVLNTSVSNAVEDIPLTINSSFLLIGSSAGPNESNQTLTITNAVVTTPNAGSASVVNGNVVFTPAKDFNGPVSVTFTATDSGTPALSASATVAITVAAVNDAPVANGSTATTSEGVPITIVGSNVVVNDRPGPATALDELRDQSVSLTGVSPLDPSVGSVSLVSGNLVFTPANFFNGEAVVGYTITDTGVPALTAQGQLRIRVTEVNNAPVPVNASRNGFASLPTAVNLSSELASASRGAPNESTQTLTITRVIRLANTVGTVALNADGTITYTAPTGFSGPDSFSYEVRDNGTTNGVLDAKTGIATVTMNIAPFVPSVVNGTVWIDDDNDGSIDSDEQRLSGVEVRLTGRSIGSTSDITPLVTRTLATGQYSFDLLPPGSYTVSYVVPSLMLDAAGDNAVTRTIVAPGGADVRVNFATRGIDYSQFSAQNRSSAVAVENLASSFYGTYPNIKQKGVVGLVRPDGTSAWTSRRDGDNGDFASAIFTEIVLSDDRRTAFLTTVDQNGTIMTASVPRSKLAVSEDLRGNLLVYVLARHSELSFSTVNPTNGVPRVSARGYLQSVDQALADYDFS
ncbi:MAG: tandem-95 repeat protein [Planctomycetota bacterium]|nr:tandem-95 repeat protein [Planctomycetota bacterium]